MRCFAFVACVLALPAWAQWLPEPGTHPPYLSTPGDITAGGDLTAHDVHVRGNLGVDGGVRANSYAALDGGRAYAPGGLTVDPGSFLCLDDPTCNYRIYKSATQLVLNGAGQPVACIDGFAAQGIIEAGTLQANSCELVGGASACTVRSAAGTVATPDAGLDLEAGGPNGLTRVTRPAGIQMAQFGAVDAGIASMTGKGFRPPSDALPTACSSVSGPYMSFFGAEQRPDGGVEWVPAWCDSQDYRAMVSPLPYSASSAKPGGGGYAAGDRWLTTNNSAFGGEMWWCTYDVAPTGGGVGAGTYTVQVKQGATILCESPAISCTTTGIVWDGDARPGTGNGPCQANYIVPRPAGSAPGSYVVNVSFSAGCTTFPVGNLSCYSRRNTLQRSP